MQQDLRTYFHENGIKFSEQKCLIYETILKTKGLFNAQDIYAKLCESIDRATVFRSLSQFVQKGLIKEISHTKKMRFFELANTNHAHFFCDICHIVECVDLPINIDLGANEIHEISLRGTCKNCSPKRKKT